MIPTNFIPRSQGHALDLRPESFGELQCSADLLGDATALQTRMQEHGYLYIRGFFRRDDILAARQTVIQRMAARGWLDPQSDPMDGVIRQGVALKFQPELGENNPELDYVLYQGPLMEFYRRLFGEEVRHFDFTWFRVVGPGWGPARIATSFTWDAEPGTGFTRPGCPLEMCRSISAG